MVRLLLLLVLLGNAAHAAQLNAKLDARQSRLGEPVLLQLEARGKDATLDEVDLGALESDFEVFGVTRSSGDNTARLDAILYPLRSGTLTLPVIEAGGARSKPLTLQVTEDPDLALAATFTPDSIFERQRSTLLLAIRDRADRQWTTPVKLEAPGLLLRPLGEQQFEEGAGSERVNVRELRWEALGLKSDRHALKLPMLDGYFLGRRLRMPLPVAALQVRSLPGYLPVTVPVGKPDVSIDLPVRDAQVGRPLLWVLRISAPGFTPDAARALLRLPQGEQAGLRFYPPAFAEEEAGKRDGRALRIEIPIVPTRAGIARLPVLALPYFDPASRRLERIEITTPELPVSNPAWKKVAGVAGVVASLIVSGFLLYRARVWWERRQARRAARQRIAMADTFASLVHAVCAYSTSPHPLTLRLWLSGKADQARLEPLVEELERAHFGERCNVDLEGLKQRWLAALLRQAI